MMQEHLIADADVVVAGAGPGGLGAALMSARAGAKTVVVEQYGVPGGMAAVAEVHPFMCSHLHGQSLDAPVYGEWIRAMADYQPEAFNGRRNAQDYSSRTICKYAASLAAEDLLLAAGVRLLYHHTVTGVVMDGRRISALRCHSKSGFGTIRGKVFIDSTGDGDLAALAGCVAEQGDELGGCQPMTLCFKLSHVRTRYQTLPSGARLFDPAWKEELSAAYHRATASGKLHCPRENVLIFPFQAAGEDVVHFNTTRVIGHDALDGVSFSDAEIEGRKQLRELLRWLRDDVPEFRECRLMSMGSQIGVRESRRIRGHRYLTVADFERCARFPDAVARCSYPVDVHSPHGSGTLVKVLPPGEFYEIPYGCLVPRECDNLLIGSRCISADVQMHSSLRIMPTVISLGQAAGIAAAWSAESGLAPSRLDGVELRRRLIAQGARLEI